eukprot:jgi/Chrpa1/17963/Chrysochromulina_OHIO_Genome00001746-RA
MRSSLMLIADVLPDFGAAPAAAAAAAAEEATSAAGAVSGCASTAEAACTTGVAVMKLPSQRTALRWSAGSTSMRVACMTGASMGARAAAGWLSAASAVGALGCKSIAVGST